MQLMPDTALTETRLFFAGANCRLSAVEFNSASSKSKIDKDKPALVLVHGMRDHALSMTSIARAFESSHRVLALDVRGHGHSDNPGSYAMVQMVADLRALVLHCQLQRPILLGHSLGGHIVSRYAAAFPDELTAMVLLDGMGPPRPPVAEPVEAELQQQLRTQVESMLTLGSDLRPMADHSDALTRLQRNNPGLARATAELIVAAGVEPHPEGGIRWRWDPAMNMVWQTFSSLETEEHMRWVRCPVLIVTGDRALQYWTGGRMGLQASEALYAAELQRRLQLFADARHEVLADAGHMLHYDQPEQLNVLLTAFIEGLGPG
jgi:pimeloyl-ACP methyl ester carboxylesterase